MSINRASKAHIEQEIAFCEALLSDLQHGRTEHAAEVLREKLKGLHADWKRAHMESEEEARANREWDRWRDQAASGRRD